MILLRRRALVAAALAIPFSARGQGCGLPTPRDMEGPFYKAGAPMRPSMVEPDSKGERLELAGRVLSADCRPVAGALLDFWQADEKGDYDNTGFRYRGKVAADAGGRYRIETILPPPYMGRPRHIHVKLQRQGGRVLTTQLYFPGEARGADPALVVRMEQGKAPLAARYDFVLG
jgi:protocatechuate 3,4-dioxygenase beta subunit